MITWAECVILNFDLRSLSFTFIVLNDKEGKGVEPRIEVARGYVTISGGNWDDVMREETLMAMPKCLKDCWEKYRTLKKSGIKNGNLQISSLFLQIGSLKILKEISRNSLIRKAIADLGGKEMIEKYKAQK